LPLHPEAHRLNPTSLAMRSNFLDRMRVMLTMLVVLHHTAIMFGGDGGWYLRQPADSTLAASLLNLLCAVVQSFFMGAIFLLAGYFTPGSYDGKGPGRFAKDRLVRLGLPLLVYGALIGPLTLALAEAPNPSDVLPAWGHWLQRGTFNMGPLWFAWALLIFAAAYLALRAVGAPPSRPIATAEIAPSAAALRHGRIALLLLAWGGGAFVLRLWVPTGQERCGLQIGYFASYILLFALGCLAAPHRWLESIGGKVAAPWGWVSLLTVPTLFIYAYASGAFRGQPFELHGGWTLPVLAYAFWEPFVGAGIILMLLWRLRTSMRPWPLWQTLTPWAYAAFIVHPPVVVVIGRWLLPWHAPSLLKFTIGGALAVVFSFVVAAACVRLPEARRLL
jgi:hypothetical protein